ncbi:MAG: hypothetical protein PHT54_01590 [Candidatus Nanoarchaeia archaeon]|nr:hypothetical protein [Candidatus Nanoarchaeia archaeon]
MEPGKILEKVLLGLPLIVAIIYLVYLLVPKPMPEGLQPAPISKTLIFSTGSFILGYGLFLMFIYKKK